MCKKCVDIIISKKDGRDWQEQKFDWSMKANPDIKYKYKYLKKDELDLSCSDKKETSTSCICGHSIVKCYYIYNDKRKLCYLLGSSCILTNKKSGTGTFAGYDEIEEQLEELDTMYCDVCDKKVKSMNYVKHCSSPMHHKRLKIKNFRMCKVCKDYKIEKSKPSYYNKCLQCYKADQMYKEFKLMNKLAALTHYTSTSGEKRFGFV